MSEEATVVINGNASEGSANEGDKSNQPEGSGITNEVEKVVPNTERTNDEIVKTETGRESPVKESNDVPTKDIEKKEGESNEKDNGRISVDDQNHEETSVKTDTLNTDTTPTVVDTGKTDTDTIKENIVKEEAENKTDIENEASQKTDDTSDQLNKVDTESTNVPNEQSEQMHDGTDIKEDKPNTSENINENNGTPNDTTSTGKDTEIKANDVTDVNEESNDQGVAQKDDLIPSNENNSDTGSASPTNVLDTTTIVNNDSDAEMNVVANTSPDNEKTESSEKDLPAHQDNVSDKKADSSETSKNDNDSGLTVQGQAISSPDTHSEVKDSVSKESSEESEKTENGDNMQTFQESDDIQNEIDKAYGDGVQEPSEVRISSAPESTVGSERAISAASTRKQIEHKNEDADDNEGGDNYDEDFEDDAPNDTAANSGDTNVEKDEKNISKSDSTDQRVEKSEAVNASDGGDTNSDKERADISENDSKNQSGDKSDETINVADSGDKVDDKENGDISESGSTNQSGDKSDTVIDNTGAPAGDSNISHSDSPAKEEREGGDILEEDGTSVSVVVDNDGMPKVVVTTVPDRPPSSQDSLSSENEAFDDSDTGNAGTSKDESANEGAESASNMNESELAKTDTNDGSKDGKETNSAKDTEEIIENAETKADSKEGKNDNVPANSEDNSVSQDDLVSKNQDIPAETSGLDESKMDVENTTPQESVETDKTEKSVVDESPSESKSVEKENMQNNDADKSVVDVSKPESKPVEKENVQNNDTEKSAVDKSKSKSKSVEEENTQKKDAEQSVVDESQPESNRAESKGSKEDTSAEEETVEQDVVETVQETALEKLLKRNVEIDGTVESITELESTVVKLLDSMKSVLNYYLERLTLQPLKDLSQEIEKFRGDFTSINEAYQRCSNMSMNMNQHLKALRHINEDVKSMISRKFQSEDLNSWVDVSPEQEKEKDKLYEETIAAEKQAMSKAADARQAVAMASIGVAEAKERAAEMEVQAAEAEVTAKKAAALAKAALITAQEARRAAEERRIAEEEARHRNEERARAKAEEEKKKQAQEEMKIYQEAARKGVSVEEEAKRFKEEKARKEAERRNPKNWPMHSYHFKAGDFDPGVGCAIRAMDDSIMSDDVTCEYVEQSRDILPMRGTEQLISNITRVKLNDDTRKLQLEEPMSVALPICISRAPLGKEAVVKQQTANGTWRELPTADVHFDDYREQKFLEGRCRSFGLFAVVLRLKKDKLQFQKKGNRQISSVDSRVSFVASEGTFTHNTNATLEVQQIDPIIVSDMKIRSPDICEDLISCSPIVNLVLPVRKFDKHPLNVCFPLPIVQSRRARPTTGIQRETTTPSDKETNRPKTATPAKYDDSTEETRFLYKDDKNGWTVCSKVELEPTKTRDIKTFSLKQSFGRMLLLRTKEGVRDSTREKIAAKLENAACHQRVRFVLKQRHYDAADLIVACTTSSRIDTVVKQLADGGYDEGPPPSISIPLREGQNLYMKFRGNISCVTENPSLNFIYNSNVDCIRTFHVEETDKFAQKSLHCYRGFVQVCTKKKAPPPSDSSSKPTPDTEIVLTELLVEMSKPDLEPPKPLKTAPVPLKDGPLTQEVLRHIAFELGTEWRDVALNLGLKPMRIQAILRQNINKETTQTRLDMLITWLKRIPKSEDKVQLLSNALQASGRGELAEEVRCRGNEFKQQRVLSARVSHLRQAFVKVAKARDVCKNWQEFAKGLGLKDEDVQRIEEAGGSGQEKCYSSLEAWKEMRGQEANIPELAGHLKSAHQERLSRDVESIVASHC